MDGRARLAELARPLIDALPQGVYRELTIDRLATEVGLGRAALDAILAAGSRVAAPPGEPRSRPQPRPRSGRRSLVRQAIRVVLNYPRACAGVQPPDGLAAVPQRGAGLLSELLTTIADQPDIGPAGLIERYRGRPEGPHLEALLAEEILISEDGAPAELVDSLERIMRTAVQERLEELIAKAESVGLTDAEKQELRGLRRSDPEGT